MARLSGDLKSLQQSTYLGGTNSDTVYGVGETSNGDVIAGGFTDSSDFPCTQASAAMGCGDGAQNSLGGGGGDGFVARLAGDLKTLLQSTYLGGAGYEVPKVVAVTSNGDVIVAGITTSIDFPCTLANTTTGCGDGAQKSFGNGYQDGFVARLSGDLQATYPQSITFGVPSPSSYTLVTGGTFVINPLASASSGLVVNYASSTPDVCTVSGSQVTMLTAGNCTIMASQPGNAKWAAAGDVSQSVALLPNTLWNGVIPSMTGNAQVDISGGSATCTIDPASVGFDGAASAQAQADLQKQYPGATLPNGVFAFSANGCAGNTLTVTITYPQTLPAQAQLLKWGPPAAGQANSWFNPGASVSGGTTVSYTVTDNGAGDSDTTHPGVISDPFAPVLLAAQPVAVPTLNQWALMVLSLMAAALGALALRKRAGLAA